MPEIHFTDSHETVGKQDDIEKILRLAEDLQNKVERAGPRILAARGIAILGVLGVIVTPIPRINLPGLLVVDRSNVSPLAYLMINLIIAGTAVFLFEHLFITRLRSQFKRDSRALSQAVTLLQELESTFTREQRWTTLEKAFFKIRMARFDVVPTKIDSVTVTLTESELEGRFALIDALAEDAQGQWIIAMHETGKEAPRYGQHMYEYHNGSAGQGMFEGFGSNKLEGTGLVQSSGAGRYLKLTPQGHQFAQWLLRKGRKADFFWSPIGGWGTPKPGGGVEKWLQAKKEAEKAGPETGIKVNPSPTS